MSDKETIEGVAIISDGKTYQLPRPKRHHDVIGMIYEQTGQPVVDQGQGFITSTGRYVNRQEGLVIAKAAGQLLERHFHETDLFSESVW